MIKAPGNQMKPAKLDSGTFQKRVTVAALGTGLLAFFVYTTLSKEIGICIGAGSAFAVIYSFYLYKTSK